MALHGDDMSIPSDYRGVINRFKDAPKEIRKFFPSFIKLINNYEWDVCVSYIFTRIEFAKHMTIYRGIVKLHRTDANLTRKAIDVDEMRKQRFLDLFEIVFDKSIDKKLLAKLNEAERVRNKIVHGKSCKDVEIRKALVDIIEFAEGFNDFVYSLAEFRPFTDDMRGFKGRAEPLNVKTTRWVLKGMDFAV